MRSRRAGPLVLGSTAAKAAAQAARSLAEAEVRLAEVEAAALLAERRGAVREAAPGACAAQPAAARAAYAAAAAKWSSRGARKSRGTPNPRSSWRPLLMVVQSRRSRPSATPARPVFATLAERFPERETETRRRRQERDYFRGHSRDADAIISLCRD